MQAAILDNQAAVTLNHIAERYFKLLYQQTPGQATMLGIHDYDDQLGSLDERDLLSTAGQVRQLHGELCSLDQQGFGLRERTNYKLLRAHMESNLIVVEEEQPWRNSPQFYVEVAVFSVFMLLIREFAPLEVRLKHAASRTRQIPALLASARKQVQDPPQVYTEIAIETAHGGLAIFSQLLPRLAAQLNPAHAALRDEVVAASNEAAAAIQDFAAWLENDLLPRSNGSFRLGHDRFVRRVLQRDHMIDATPEQVLARGHAMFDETLHQLEEAAAAIDPHKTWAELIAEGSQQHPAATDLVQAYADETLKLRQFVIEQQLVTIPAGETLNVAETPAFQRSIIPFAAYMMPGPYDTKQEGDFWVTPVAANATPEAAMRQLSDHSWYNIPAIAAHEGYPGHHLQLIYANKYSDDIRNQAGISSLFVEGWGLYTEQLMHETGYYSDPHMRLFQLKGQLWRAARVIIDISLHCGEMSVEEAVTFLHQNVKMSEQGARGEVRRYTTSPGQPMSYLFGKAMILDLREEVRQREGAAFSLQAFHDRLLSSGSIQVALIREEMMSSSN